MSKKASNELVIHQISQKPEKNLSLKYTKLNINNFMFDQKSALVQICTFYCSNMQMDNRQIASHICLA